MNRFCVRKAILLHIILLSVFIIKGQSPYISVFEMNQFEISHVGFNTFESDFGPSYVGEELWFSSYNKKDLKKLTRGRSKNVYYSLFTTPVNGMGITLYEPRQLITDIQTGMHEGPVSFSENTGELFVTLSNTVEVDVKEDGLIMKRQRVRLRLVVCKEINNQWTITEEIPFNDKVYSVGHPSVTPNGDTLYFVSDNPALSMGGTDIFYSVRQNGIWGNPVSVGEKINTEGNEMFPFYHPLGMLIFASNGRNNNKGGLDLYCSELTPEGFTEPIPLDAFNTPYDDFGLVIHNSGEAGYFVSNRPGQNGSDDIYLVKIRKTFMPLSGTVFDDFTNKTLASAPVTLYNCDGTRVDSTRTNANGYFSFKVNRGNCYVASSSLPDYPENRKAYQRESHIDLRLKPDRIVEFQVIDYESRQPIPNALIIIDGEKYGITSLEGKISKKLFTEHSIEVEVVIAGYLNHKIVVNTENQNRTKLTLEITKLELLKTFTLFDVWFEKDNAILTNTSTPVLDNFVSLLKMNPAIKVEIGSHTDSRNADGLNLQLSQRRADAIANYLIRNGIGKDRLVAKGYGETKLLNHCKNGVQCTDIEHAVNERTEIKIIGFVK